MVDPESESEDVEPAENSTNSNNLKVRKVAIGMTHSLCLTECGRLFGWGLSGHGQLGSIATKKRVAAPTALGDFEGGSIADIECFGQCSVIQIEQKGVYVMGFNDALFDGKVHREPHHVQLSGERVRRFGCSRRDFVVLTATAISAVSPSIAVAQGTELVIRGHGVYRTPHRPMVQFVVSSEDQQNATTLTKEARFIQLDDDEQLCLSVTSPDLRAHSAAFPLTVQMSVAPDGRHFSEAQELWAVAVPGDDEQFAISPQCGAEEGNVQCTVTSSTEYISAIASRVNLENIRVRFVGKEEEADYAVDARVDGQGQIGFGTPPMARGLYQVEVAVDGQQFVDIHCAFRSYKVECTQCAPEMLDLSKQTGDGVVDLELSVCGFLPVDATRVALKCASKSGDAASFTAECVYESQSARDIAAAELESKKEFEAQRTAIRSKEEEELDAVKASLRAEEDEHEERVAKMEREKKKKKKAEELEQWESERKQEADRWAETLRARAKAQREIARKCKRELMFSEKAESEIPRRLEADPNGEGLIRCKVDTAKLRGWPQPNDIQLMITLNGSLFSNLCSIRSIHPRIKQMAPRLGALSESTAIRMVVEGFNVEEAADTALTVTVRDDTAERETEIESVDVAVDAAGCSVVNVQVSGLTAVGEKVITLKYGDSFQIPAAFLLFDALKITAVSPKEVAVGGAGKMTLDFSGDLDGHFVDDVFVRITANEQSVVLKGVLNDDGNGVAVEWDGEEQSLAAIGAAKKAQIELSFNEQQWVAAKQTIALK